MKGRQNMNSMITNYARLFENAVKPTGKIDSAKSLIGWQNRAIIAHEAIQEIKRQHNEIRKQIDTTYRPEAAKTNFQPYEDEYNDVLRLAKARLEEDLDEVCESKRTAFQKSLSAPTEEQLRLLQVLALRDDITAAEAGSIAAKLGNNLHCQKAFASILKKNGLNAPRLITEEEFEEKLSVARKYAEGMIENIGIDFKDMSFDQAHFFRAPGTGFAALKFSDLDSNGFIAAQITEITRESDEKAGTDTQKKKTGDTQEKKPVPESGYNATRIYIQGYESLNMIAAQFGTSTEAIKAANPGQDLSKLESGMKIIVPGTKMRISKAEGAVSPDACIPATYDPTPAKVYQEGESVTIE